MADISDKPRTFTVYLDRNVTGADTIEEEVKVGAGEDADVACLEVLNELIGGYLDTGWYETEQPKSEGADG